jgi:hypothetical protein
VTRSREDRQHGVWCGRFARRIVVVAMGLPGESIPIIVEPLRLPDPAREPGRDGDTPEPEPVQPLRAPTEPVPA